jgi:uncharacterized protein (DUF1778 family)
MADKPADTAATGASYRRRAGLKPISCDLPPEDYELVRQAAFDARVSMSAFVRAAAADAARKAVGKKSGK